MDKYDITIGDESVWSFILLDPSNVSARSYSYGVVITIHHLHVA